MLIAGNRSTGMRTIDVRPMTVTIRQTTTIRYGFRIAKRVILRGPPRDDRPDGHAGPELASVADDDEVVFAQAVNHLDAIGRLESDRHRPPLDLPVHGDEHRRAAFIAINGLYRYGQRAGCALD